MGVRSARLFVASATAIAASTVLGGVGVDAASADRRTTVGVAHTVVDGAPTSRAPHSLDVDIAAPPAVTASPVLPTIDFDAYADAKADANATVDGSRRDDPEPAGAPKKGGLKVRGVNRKGVTSEQTGTAVPDPHGGAGGKHFAHVVNGRFRVVKKAKPKKVTTDVSLATFFDYAAAPLEHPQVVFDHRAKRWIVSAAARPESSTVQRLFVAVSGKDNPNGSFDIYDFDVDVVDEGTYLDHPLLGFNDDAIVLTANVFDAPPPATSTYLDTQVLVVPKADAYAGDAVVLSVLPVGPTGSLAPPVVLDGGEDVYLLQALPAADQLMLWKGTGFGGSEPAVTLTTPVDVVPYSVPPDAPQPGTDVRLDTGDGRFSHASTQYADRLWNAHTIEDDGLATPRFYLIRTTSSVALQAGNFWANSSSSDFNVSIAANKKNDAFVTWTSTDADLGINAEIRFSGRRKGDEQNRIRRPGTVLGGSAAAFTPGADPVAPWGTHSAVALDPKKYGECGKGKRAWIVNERIQNATTWGTRFGRIGYC